MPNPYFKYKQFTVYQDKTAQKVCTDTSLFGALLTPDEEVKEILDIGTGTGVLSLMVAQKSEAKITAIEIEQNACQQAKANVDRSDWHDRINVLHEDIIKFADHTDRKFDLILSNPPFFQNSYKSHKVDKNKARHNETLGLPQLATCVNSLLLDEGSFWVILPEYESGLLKQELLEYGLNQSQRIDIHNYTEDIRISRIVSKFTKDNSSTVHQKLAIYKDQNREYTDDFIQLLKPYYLYL